MEWSKELEEIGENLFAEYELDRDPLKEAYMAGAKSCLCPRRMRGKSCPMPLRSLFLAVTTWQSKDGRTNDE